MKQRLCIKILAIRAHRLATRREFLVYTPISWKPTVQIWHSEAQVKAIIDLRRAAIIILPWDKHYLICYEVISFYFLLQEFTSIYHYSVGYFSLFKCIMDSPLQYGKPEVHYFCINSPNNEINYRSMCKIVCKVLNYLQLLANSQMNT